MFTAIFVFLRTTLLVAGALLCGIAQAQPWPNKPIKLIVPFPAGGPTDLVGREAANILRSALGQSVVVENRAGGNGTVGLEVLAKSAPDGYTIGLTAITLSIAPHLGNAPFDPFKDFSPITNLVSMTPLIVAPWFGLGGPAGMPPEMIRKMHEALVKGMQGREAIDRFTAIGATISTNASPEEFTAYIRSEYARWGEVIHAAGIKVE